MADAQSYLESIAGQTMRGGCADCDATQTVVQDDECPNLFVLRVEHAETCPSYRAMQKRRSR